MKTKKITTKLFDIIKQNVDTNDYNIQEKFLSQIYHKNIKDRYQQLDIKDKNNEGYVVISYTEVRDTIFGVFAKLANENSIHIKKEELNKDNISLDELILYTVDDQEGIVKDYYYFCLYKNKLLINCGRSIKPFQTYINLLINDNNLYECRPVIIKEMDLELSNIKSISINENYLSQKNNENTITELKTTLNNFINKIPNLFDVVLPNNINIKDIISAEILLKFKNNNGRSKKENYHDTLKSLLKAGVTDDLVIRTKNNKVYRGSEIEASYSFDVELTKTQLPNEENIKQEMIAYIKNDKN